MNAELAGDWPPDLLEPLVEALAAGVEAEEEAHLLAAAACGGGLAPGADPAPLRRAVLDTMLAEPWLGEALAALEEWLDGEQDTEVTIPLATGWALPAAGLDLDAALEEARLYIDAYPFEGRIVGDLDRRAARWLAERLSLVQARPAQRLPAVRRAIGTLAEAAERAFPVVAGSLLAIANELPDERLWYELALRITQRQLTTRPG